MQRDKNVIIDSKDIMAALKKVVSNLTTSSAKEIHLLLIMVGTHFKKKHDYANLKWIHCLTNRLFRQWFEYARILVFWKASLGLRSFAVSLREVRVLKSVIQKLYIGMAWFTAWSVIATSARRREEEIQQIESKMEMGKKCIKSCSDFNTIESDFHLNHTRYLSRLFRVASFKFTIKKHPMNE